MEFLKKLFRSLVFLIFTVLFLYIVLKAWNTWNHDPVARGWTWIVVRKIEFLANAFWTDLIQTFKQAFNHS